VKRRERFETRIEGDAKSRVNLLLRINLLLPPVFPSNAQNGISKISKITVLLLYYFYRLLISILFQLYIMRI